MKRVLLTGMSGTGKSTLARELSARGYKTVDMDDAGWSEWRAVESRPGVPPADGGREWVWCDDRVAELLSADDPGTEVLFVSGCASNQWRFYPAFDHIILLSVPAPVLVERLATRTTNSFGKSPQELAKILEDQRAVEPLLRRIAGLEVDTSMPLSEVADTVLRFVILGGA